MRKNGKFLVLLIAVIACITFAMVGCGKAEELTSADVIIALDNHTQEVRVNETVTLGVNVGEKLKGKEYAITYNSLSPAVASVDADGKVKGLTIGKSKIEATITYNDFTASDECEVTVKGMTPAVDVDAVYNTVYSDGITLADLVNLDDGYVWKEGCETALHAGDGQRFTIVYTPADPTKYETVEIAVIVNVEKAEQLLRAKEIVGGGKIYAMFYSDKPTDIAALALFEYETGKTVTYSMKKANGDSVNLLEPIDEGKYILTASIAGTADYKAASDELPFSVTLTPKDVFIRDMDGLSAGMTEDRKAEILANYALLMDDEKAETVVKWNATIVEKYADFFKHYVQSVDVGSEDNYFTYFHTAYGASQVKLSYAKTPAGAMTNGVKYDSGRTFADEGATLNITSSADHTVGTALQIGLKNISFQDITGADAVFSYVYNNSDYLMTLQSWPSGTVLKPREWTLLRLPAGVFGVANKGLPAKDQFGKLTLNISFYFEGNSSDRLDHGVNVNFTSWTAATPVYVNGLIGKLNQDAPDLQLIQKIYDAYHMLSAVNKALVTGYAQIERLYVQEILHGKSAPKDVVVNFQSEAGARQVYTVMRDQALSAYYAKTAVAPSGIAADDVTVYENRIGSLVSYHKFDMTVNTSLIQDFSAYNVLEFNVYFESPRNTSDSGNGLYYLETGGKKFTFALNKWHTVRLDLPTAVAGMTLTFYAYKDSNSRSACFFMDKIYLTDIKAVLFDFKENFILETGALSSLSTTAEIQRVRTLYDNLAVVDKTDVNVAAAYNTFYATYYKAPALAQLNAKISALESPATPESINKIINFYKALEPALKEDSDIKAAYDAFYETNYVTLFKTSFVAKVDALTDRSTDADVLAVLKEYNNADVAIKADAVVSSAYTDLRDNFILKRLNAKALVDLSSDLAKAYYLKDKVVNPDAAQTVTYSLKDGFADEEKSLGVDVSENWTAKSEYQMLPQIQNGSQAVTVCLYVKSTDLQYRKIQSVKAKDMNGTWKGPASKTTLEKNTWTFVSVTLAADEYFYLSAQWWKDASGKEKYSIGYPMSLQFSSMFTASSGYVSALIAEADLITDAGKKAEYTQKIKDIYGVLSADEKGKVVGYDAYIASLA